MQKHPSHEPPIRSKLEMCKDIIEIIHKLHEGDRKGAEAHIKDLKVRSLFLSEEVQQDVMNFSEQVAFQYDYDPWHKVTPEVTRAADRLLRELGFKYH